MSTINLKQLTISRAKQELVDGNLTARDLVEAYLKEIDEKNPDLNAYLEVFADAKDIATKIDKRGDYDSLPLAGIPIAIKDNILIKGKKVSAASKMLTNYIATYDAMVIQKLLSAGAILLGRTNMDEFAMGGSTENSSFGPTKNPHDLTRVAGGSSGGSTAAVSADLALAALGSDTGGSVRQPASFCGVVGLKPTYGTVSRSGLIAMASSLDQIGPVTKTVADSRLLYNVIKGADKLDATSIDIEKSNNKSDKLVIGVPTDFLAEGLDQAVRKNLDQTIKTLTEQGCVFREISLPYIKYALACYYIIMPAEASSNLARFDGVKYGLKVEGQDLLDDYLKTRQAGFGLEVRRRIILGTYVLSAGYYDAYYAKAGKVRDLIRRDYEKIFTSGVDAVLTPTTPTPAWKLGEKTSDPLQMYLEDIFTVPANLTGLPALSVPSGKTDAGLPLGIQFMAGSGREDILFTLGEKLEQALVTSIKN